MPLSVVVAGLVARFPLGGVAWDYLQYVAGFARLGCEVFYLEDTGDYCYDPRLQTFTPECSANAAYLARAAARFGLPDGRWCLRNWDGACHGVSLERLMEVLARADLFVNVSGTCWLRDEYRALPMRKVFIDTDPGYNQARIVLGSRPGAERRFASSIERVRAHDAHFTFGENWGAADAAMPATPGIAWRTTRQPIALDLLPPAPPARARPLFTTVMSWKADKGELELDGRRYGGKASAFERYLGVPARFGRRFEVALAGAAPLERLGEAGFAIADADAASGDADRYAAYLAGSRGEWSVAKEVYTAMRTGWFSCRTACYLALGRPAIVEDTGFRPYYPSGGGLFAFSSEDEIGAALEAIDRDYEGACRAARAVAEECFDARRVLAPIAAVA
jgi:hypothetical protein